MTGHTPSRGLLSVAMAGRSGAHGDCHMLLSLRQDRLVGIVIIAAGMGCRNHCMLSSSGEAGLLGVVIYCHWLEVGHVGIIYLLLLLGEGILVGINVYCRQQGKLRLLSVAANGEASSL